MNCHSTAPKCNLEVLLLLNPESWSPSPNQCSCALSCPTHLSSRASFHSEWRRVLPWWLPGHLWRRTSPALWDHQASLCPLCPTGIILPSPFMGFITTQRCGQTQRYNGGGRRRWDALSTATCPPAPALRFLSPGRLMLGVWLHMSWPRCVLCRCLTHLGSHQVLLDTAMPSCPSQEDPGEASVLGEADVTGCYLLCVTVYIHMWSMKFCFCILMCWEGGLGLHVQESLQGPPQWHWPPDVHKDWPHFHVSGQSKVSRVYLTLGVWLFSTKSFHER